MQNTSLLLQVPPPPPPPRSSSTSTSISKFISDHPILSLLEKSCTSMTDLRKLHATLIKTGLSKHTIAASRLLSFCANSPFGDINYAYSLFSQIQTPNLFIWNTIIRCFSQSSTPQIAISLFIHMLYYSPKTQPDTLTYPSLFKAYGLLGLAQDGTQLHGRITKLGLQSDPYIRNTIIFMYVNSPGYMMAAYYNLFDKEHLNFDIVSWNSMIMGLAKNGLVDDSRRLFDTMPFRNTISWNSMIGGYVRNGRLKEALQLFHSMQTDQEGLKPDEFTMVSLLNACGHLGALKQGQWLHAYTKKSKIKVNTILLTAIIDMYCKCGSINQALEAFSTSMPSLRRGLSCWNSLILGLAMNGHGKEAIQLFPSLHFSGLKPDEVTFIGLLTACNHSGMVSEAQYYFTLMTETYMIEPTVKHYGCMVDVLGRAGYLQEAEELINNMNVNPDDIIWGSLLSACRKHGNIELGEKAAKQLRQLDPNDSGSFLLLSNMYASSGKFVEAMDARLAMKRKEIQKEPGCSLIELNGEVHEFVVGGGTSHPQAKQIHALLYVLDSMLKWPCH